MSSEIVINAITHRGRRSQNEDYLVIGPTTIMVPEMTSPTQCVLSHEGCVLAAVDGMGGHAAGDIAAEHVARRLAAAGPKLRGVEDISSLLSLIGQELVDHGNRNSEFSGMGATVAGVVLNNDVPTWFNVGDARLYRIEGSRVHQISRDDTPAGSGSRNFITQSLGSNTLTPHVGELPTPFGAAWMMTSDGVNMSVQEIEDVLATSASDGDAVSRLCRGSITNGDDNVCVLLARTR